MLFDEFSARARLRARWVLAFVPVLLAQKCFDPDPVLTGQVDARPASEGTDSVMTSTTTEDAGFDSERGEADSGVVVSTRCANDGEAHIQVRDFAYQIRCGCVERTGSTCTVPVGTRVVWTFLDAEEHDVASAGGRFPQSGERSTGTFSHVFAEVGDFPYYCNIHIGDMNGYVIRVR
ncbi:MAG: hypothetical protein HY791_03200 [Deltaproteobacteria bacterium]|nr:hypothetical protein [Deltaproteobacteria bacterium]